MLKIYNSLTRKKETFKPIRSGFVNMYVCGPTVYDYIHIGNARSFTAFDLVVRYLRFRGLKVKYVRNITDIEDKIIKRANENNEHFQVIVDRFTQAVQEDLKQLGLLKPDYEPRATEYIPQIIDMINTLIKNGFAYIASNGDVYYEVRKFKAYGCLAHRNIDQLESGARVEIADVKRDPLDFVLWKLAKPGEPEWDSPWGKGRPGWHIECSAMTTSLLGETFDIHGGGKDLIFPHHENEIAQSEAATDKKFVNVWMHAGYLRIQNEKMSKSLKNFLTIHDLIKDHAPEVLRFFLISSHYRSQLNFTENAFQQSRNALERFYTALRDLPSTDAVADDKYEQKFIDAMDDDFNTPVALSVLFDLAHEIQRLRNVDPHISACYGTLLKKLGNVLGILQQDPQVFLKGDKGDIDANYVESLIEARNKARSEKNWAEADRIRQELTKMSIVLEDSAGKTTWKIVK